MIISLGISIILLLTLLIQPISSTQIEKVKPSEHLDGYCVTKYVFKGIKYSKETIEISENDAMKIKQAFENIDTSVDDNKITRKHNILMQHGLISNEDEKTYNKIKGKFSSRVLLSDKITLSNDSRGTDLFLTSIEGFFGPCILNELNFFVMAPVFYSIALGINVNIQFALPPVHFDFISTNLVIIGLIAFIGTLIVLPFISPGGFIFGITFLGTIQEVF
jgi:hypothetical protein